MRSITSSFRISEELNRRLAAVAERCGNGKNAILIEALSRYLAAMDRDWLTAEARRQSEIVSRNERDDGWYEMADPSAWK